VVGLLRFFTADPPPAVLEIAADRVTGVAFGEGHGVTTVTEVLPEGVLVPSPNAANMVDPDVVAGAVKRVVERLPGVPTRIGLVLPDAAAKVSLIPFEQVPPRAADLDELVRWQLRKTSPFRMEDAQVAYVPGRRRADGACEFVVTLMRRDVVGEYEGACASANTHAGVVDLASFSVVNAVLAVGAPEASDWLLVHVTSRDSSMLVLRRRQLILFRNRPTSDLDQLVDFIHQTTMYYEDRLQGEGFARMLLVATGLGEDLVSGGNLRRSLESRLGTSMETIDFGHVVTAGEDTRSLGDRQAPSLGLLWRERTPVNDAEDGE